MCALVTTNWRILWLYGPSNECAHRPCWGQKQAVSFAVCAKEFGIFIHVRVFLTDWLDQNIDLGLLTFYFTYLTKVTDLTSSIRCYNLTFYLTDSPKWLTWILTFDIWPWPVTCYWLDWQKSTYLELFSRSKTLTLRQQELVGWFEKSGGNILKIKSK